MEEDVSTTAWTGAEEQQVTLRGAHSTHRRTTQQRGADAELLFNGLHRIRCLGAASHFELISSPLFLGGEAVLFMISDSPCSHLFRSRTLSDAAMTR